MRPPARRPSRVVRVLLLAGFLAGPLLAAEPRRIPFWPDRVPEVLGAEVDGVAALDTVRQLGRFHRVHGSPGFVAAADYVRSRLVAAGLGDAIVEHFPADGKTSYAHFRSYLGWQPLEAQLEEVSPRPRVISRFPDLSVALADYSQDADVTAELVDVGAGADAKDYAAREVKGRIALASGALPRVHRLACEERGAAGFLSDFPNQTTAWSGDDRDLVRWGHLSPYQTKNTFAFMLSRRQSQELRARLAAGETIVLRARVRARMVPASYDVVSATIPGTDRAREEVVLTAHLCHQSAGANDNASGSAAILEVARALQAAIARGALPRPSRTIRFLWLPEIAGSQAYLVRHPEVAAGLVGGIHMDMVGGLLATTHGTFHLSRSAESLPHVVSDVARAWLADVMAVSSRYAERGGDPRRGLVWLPGSREAFLGDFRGVEMGSDHQVFEEGTWKVPMVYFHDWPDVTIHTNKDLPENLDATKLGRVAYMGAGIAWTLAALPAEEAPALLGWVEQGAGERLSAAAREAGTTGGYDGYLRGREAERTNEAVLRSLDRLWPSARKVPVKAVPSRFPAVPAPAGRDARVPTRRSEVRGPLDVYYYDHLTETLGEQAASSGRISRRSSGDVLSWEALNLVDGRRSVAEIRDVLAGRYEPVPVEELSEYFELLERAAVVRFGQRAPASGR
jgi:aminopeptidase YwaD